MSTFIITSEPSRIALCTTCTVPQAILDGLRRDFELGAHKGYDEALALDISERTDLHGLETAEDVLRALEADGTHAQEEEGFHPFLIADEDTVKSATDGQYIVWYVESWAEEEDFEPDALEPSAELAVDEEGRYNFASKGRFYTYAVPGLYVNLEIASTSLQEELDFPYDPFGPHEPQNCGADWRLEPPYGPGIMADASHYEVQAHPQVDAALGLKKYRLRKEVADRLGVISNWTEAGPYDYREREHRADIMEKAQIWTRKLA